MYECPKEFTLDNSKGGCVRSISGGSFLECPKDMVLEGSECASRAFAPIQHQCPKGFLLENSPKGDFMCRKRALPPSTKKVPYSADLEDVVIPAEVLCPVGFAPTSEKQPTECTRLDFQPALQVCEKGFTQVAGVKSACTKDETVSPFPVCHEGLALDKATEKCVAEVRKEPELVCEPGYTASSQDRGMCETTEIHAPRTGCPPNFNLEESADKKSLGRCVGEEAIPPRPVCPPQYNFDEAQGLCIGRVLADPIESCPAGFVRVEEGCLMSQSQPPMPACVLGFSLKFGEVCERVLEEKPGTICPAGFMLYDGRCLRTEMTTPPAM